jgi:hypothetical protein
MTDHREMKTYRETEIKLHIFLTANLDGSFIFRPFYLPREFSLLPVGQETG